MDHAVLMNIKNLQKTGPAMAWPAGPSATALHNYREQSFNL